MAEPLRGLGDGVEHGLHIGGRAGDDVEHPADRGLIVERLLHLASTRLHLVEQPHILDRDHRLVSECGHQLDLLVGERPRHRTDQDDYPNRRFLAHQRDPEPGANGCDLLSRQEGIFGVGQNVGNVDRAPLVQSAPCERPAATRDGRAAHEVDECLREPVVGSESEGRAFRPDNARHVGLAQSGRGLDQRIEHPLQIKGRAADDLEHVGSGGLLL